MTTQAQNAARISPPQIVDTKAQHTAVIRLAIPRSEMMHVFGPAVQELLAVLTAQGLPPGGSAFAHHLKMSPATFDFELGFTVPLARHSFRPRRTGHLAGAKGCPHGLYRTL